MKIGRIYRIKDLSNGNCYYGSTTKTVEQRFNWINFLIKKFRISRGFKSLKNRIVAVKE